MRVKKDGAIRNQIIKLVVMRCRKDTIEPTLRKWGRLSEDVLVSLKGKRKGDILRAVQEAVEEKPDLTDEFMGDLELSYIQLHSRTKLWTVYKLSGREMELSHDPRAMRSHLLTNVQLKWKQGRVFGNMSYYSGSLWFRLHLSSSLSRRKVDHSVYNPTRSVFVAAFVGSPFIIMSQTSGQIFKIVSEALIEVFKSERLHDIKLSGHHIASLADIALKKNSMADVCSYLDAEENGSQFALGQKRKSFENDDFENREDVIDENRKEKRQRQMDIDKKFGPDRQPILETLEYKFDVPFRGKPAGVLADTHCKSTVQLKGTSVLDGLRQMARRGFLKFPLPQHVYSATSNQRNHFSVVSRRERERSQTQ